MIKPENGILKLPERKTFLPQAINTHSVHHLTSCKESKRKSSFPLLILYSEHPITYNNYSETLQTLPNPISNILIYTVLL
jgi:hypothetical protein